MQRPSPATVRRLILVLILALWEVVSRTGVLAVLRNLLLPVFSSLYAVPIVILYPIFTAWFGIGSESKIAFAGVYGFFPVMLSTAAGIQTIDQNFLVAARSMGASVPQQITRVV